MTATLTQQVAVAAPAHIRSKLDAVIGSKSFQEAIVALLER